VELLDNKYQIEQLLGEGGMGAVYRATHLGTKRTVAVKVIQPQLSAHDQFVARFRREAEAAGRLRHPNVVDVTDFTGRGSAGAAKFPWAVKPLAAA
jgi:serine/threonine-protein kinase